MTYLPFWAGGLLLTAIVVGHWLVLRGQLGVSGRLTVLVNRFRTRGASEPELSEDELLAAVRAMTAEEFGAAAVDPRSSVPPDSPPAVTAEDTPTSSHLLFFVGLALGGLLAAVASRQAGLSTTLAGASFAHFFGGGPATYAVLLGGGILVGFGTRMGGGCTSGHGLLGLSRLQPGSLVATACFFGAGIGASFLLEVLR